MHDSGYWAKLKAGQLSRQEERRTGFPWSEALVQREVMIMGGTVECALHAFDSGVALNIAPYVELEHDYTSITGESFPFTY